jgi:hypothetical protein
MKVSRCGGAALGSVVEDHPAGTKISHKLEKDLDWFSNGLGVVVQMGDGEVRREDRHWITEDEVFASVEDPFLYFRELIQTEKTWALVCVSFANVGQAALDPPGIVLETDGKTLAG